MTGTGACDWQEKRVLKKKILSTRSTTGGHLNTVKIPTVVSIMEGRFPVRKSREKITTSSKRRTRVRLYSPQAKTVYSTRKYRYTTSRNYNRLGISTMFYRRNTSQRVRTRRP